MTRLKLKNHPELDPNLARETQQLRDRKSHTSLITISDITVPKSYKQALLVPYWQEAMKQEIQALHDNHTWTHVPRPANINVVGSKWIFKIKFKEDGLIE